MSALAELMRAACIVGNLPASGRAFGGSCEGLPSSQPMLSASCACTYTCSCIASMADCAIHAINVPTPTEATAATQAVTSTVLGTLGDVETDKDGGLSPRYPAEWGYLSKTGTKEGLPPLRRDAPGGVDLRTSFLIRVRGLASVQIKTSLRVEAQLENFTDGTTAKPGKALPTPITYSGCCSPRRLGGYSRRRSLDADLLVKLRAGRPSCWGKARLRWTNVTSSWVAVTSAVDDLESCSTSA
ncbi:hypothetical protein K456DRAFT_462534 [Colletotrichum gloeosporioides 23]|nr:hypothetical protein K456DRAFT_462534 [Colletotrichum gloeosporioides 23]